MADHTQQASDGLDRVIAAQISFAIGAFRPPPAARSRLLEAIKELGSSFGETEPSVHRSRTVGWTTSQLVDLRRPWDDLAVRGPTTCGLAFAYAPSAPLVTAW